MTPKTSITIVAVFTVLVAGWISLNHGLDHIEQVGQEILAALADRWVADDESRF